MPLGAGAARFIDEDRGPVAFFALAVDEAYISDDVMGGRPLVAVAAGMAVSDDNDERAIWADASALGMGPMDDDNPGCWSMENRACLRGGPSPLIVAPLKVVDTFDLAGAPPIPAL